MEPGLLTHNVAIVFYVQYEEITDKKRGHGSRKPQTGRLYHPQAQGKGGTNAEFTDLP